MTATTTIETTSATEIHTSPYDVSLNLQRPSSEGMGLSIDFALTRASFQDGTQLLIGAIPLCQQHEDGMCANDCAEDTFLAELSLDEARKLRAFLNRPEVTSILDGPKLVWNTGK